MMKQESSLHSPVAIEPYEHKFVYRGRHVVRSQFPLCYLGRAQFTKSREFL